MVNEKSDSAAGQGRRPLWTGLFQGFQVALDPRKLMLAAAGIVVMAAGWWMLAEIFYGSRTKPEWYPPQAAEGEQVDQATVDQAWHTFKNDRHQWNVLNAAAGPQPVRADAGDLADKPDQYDALKAQIDNGKITPPYLPYGAMRTWPWFEDRGPNPYLLVTGETLRSQTTPTASRSLDQAAGLSWLVFKKQLRVLLEPLVKFLSPVLFLLQPRIGILNWIYFSLALVWMLATWALFGGAITRIAAVQVARKDKIGLSEAIRFTLARYISFFSAPLLPLLAVLGVTLCLILFGFLHLIPFVGDIVVDGLGWPLVILAGIVMAVVLVGLVGWPLMYATISTEGSDSFDAISRSYSYVGQSAWHYLWYSAVALAYGAVLVLFVAFMGSFMVYLGKWGVGQTPFVEKANRDPSYLFIYAPPSYQWRTLLLEGGQAPNGQPLVVNGQIQPDAVDAYTATFHPWNTAASVMVAAWLWLVFLIMIGFGYSYFWSASTIIYLLMRRNVDDTDMDEVYLEADESEDVYSPPPPTATAPAPTSATLTMVESPTLRAPVQATPAAAKAETAPPTGDGSAAPA